MDPSIIMGIFVIIILIISVITLIKEIIERRKLRLADAKYLEETGALNFIYGNHYRGLDYGEDMECTIYLYEDLLKIVPIIAIGDKDISITNLTEFNFYTKENIENMFLEKNNIDFLGDKDLHTRLRDHKKNKYKGIDGVISIKYMDNENTEKISFLYRGNKEKVIKFKEDTIKLSKIL